MDQTPGSLIGVGGFKTAQSGLLMLTPPPWSGLGSKPSQDVVVKRPYFVHSILPADTSSGPPPGGGKHGKREKHRIQCLTLADELPKLHREANTLYWAKALLTMTYDFIDCAIASADPPPFDIPRLRFVEAGLALAHSQPTNVSDKSQFAGTLVSGVFLLEELIEGGSAVFTKFIHNMDCGPSLDEDEQGYDVAEFLAFTQHVQYIKTGKLAFISDYQGRWSSLTEHWLTIFIGSTTLLTDPQILTDP